MIKNKKGQSTIEFLSSFAFILSILFLYVKMALNITNGYLLHYATFMASRAYLVYNNGSENASNDSSAQAQGNKVFSIYSDSYIGLKSGPEIKFNDPQPPMKAVFVGPVSEIKQTFSFSKLVGGIKLMTYISESFLGREPIIQECLQQVCNAMMDSLAGSSCSVASTLVDNGC